MPALDESIDDRIVRILCETKGCLTAEEVTKKIHDELGGGVSYTVKHIEARMAKLAQAGRIRQDGDKYWCLSSATQN